MPTPLGERELENVAGGGLLDTEAGTFGFEPITLERGAKALFIGETEKNIRQSTGSVTHDKSFEE